MFSRLLHSTRIQTCMFNLGLILVFSMLSGCGTQPAPPAAPNPASQPLPASTPSAVLPAKPSAVAPNQPASVKSARSAAEEEALAVIKQLGGKFEQDQNKPGTPVTAVVLYRTQISGEGLSYLKALGQLERLHIEGADKILDDDWVHLKELKSLRTLTLIAAGVTDVGLKHFKELTWIESLTIAVAGINDEGLSHLKGLTGVKLLSLQSDQNLTDSGMQHLKGLTGLRTLNLNGVIRLTDAGLEPLKGLTGLRVIDLGGTKVTEAGVRAHQNAIPDLGIVGVHAAPPRAANPPASTPAPAKLVSPPAASDQPVGEVRRFTGHTGGAWSVAFSPDGRLALSGGGLYLSGNVVERTNDFAVRLWDVESGKELKRFEGHTDTVRCVEFSPDGQRALSASWDKTIRLWDVQTGRELHRLIGHADKIATAVFSPNGTQVLSGGADMTIRLWDAASGQQLQRFDEPSRQVHGLVYSPDGGQFLVACLSMDSKGAPLDGVVSLRNAKTGEVVRHFEEVHQGWLHSLSFSPDGRRALTGSDWVMRLWDVETGKVLKKLEGHAVCFTPDGRRVLASQKDKSLVLWDLDSGSELCRFLNVGTGAIACSPDGRHALSGSSDKTLRLWRLPNPPSVASDPPAGEVRRFAGHTDGIWSVAFSSDGRQLWTGSRDGTVRIWDPDTGATVRSIDLRAGRVTRVAFAGDFRTVLTAQLPDKFVRLWNTESGLEVRRLQGHASPVWSISLTQDGRRALAGAEDGTVRLWDVNTGNEIKSFTGHTGLVQSVVFSPDGRRGLSGSQDKLVCLWDLETGKRLQNLPGHTGKVCSLEFSPDGRRAVSGGGGVDASGQPADTTVRVWDLEGGKELQCLRGHTNGVTGVAFAPDAHHVISASYDKTVRVWDVQTGKELHRFEGHAKELECVGVSPDGRFVVSGGYDPAARLWRLPEPAQEMQKLNGLWRLVKGETSKERLQPEGRQIVMIDGTYIQQIPGKTIEGTYKIDPTKKPKTIDFTPQKGGAAEWQGKTLLGIYEFEGDTFRYCVAGPGEPRPTEFTTNKPKGGQSLQAYVREKKEPAPAPRNESNGAADRSQDDDGFDEYYVQPYYLYPKDQKYFPEYEQAVRRCVREVQDWYRKQCGLTFRMAPLKVVRSEQTYEQMRFGAAKPTENRHDLPNWGAAVEKAVGGWSDRRIAWVFAQGGGGWAGGNLLDDLRGFAIFGDWVLQPISGVENPDGIPAKLATWQVQGGVPMGTTVHELGHAFGMHHPDNSDGKSLMKWHGDYPSVGFFPHEVMILRQSPFFTRKRPDPQGPYPSFATDDVAHWGQKLKVPGKRFKQGDIVEFVDNKDGRERTVPVKPEDLSDTQILAVVPNGLGPGYLRIRRGTVVSHGVPINISR